ncbi:hypothetical protein E4416_01410 [Stenotrophomonas maltophilia]|nr:hypothetical protein E4418_08685 [Stenotrophomonas maltophilia]TIK75686.1 hypothetical protein E4416_01410 [Stenotrophomonas maltophilia]
MLFELLPAHPLAFRRQCALCVGRLEFSACVDDARFECGICGGRVQCIQKLCGPFAMLAWKQRYRAFESGNAYRAIHRE